MKQNLRAHPFNGMNFACVTFEIITQNPGIKEVSINIGLRISLILPGNAGGVKKSGLAFHW
jgi:hypothetical protein